MAHKFNEGPLDTVDFEVVMYICTVCNTTKTVENNGDNIKEVDAGYCFTCKWHNSFKRLGRFILKKVVE